MALKLETTARQWRRVYLYGAAKTLKSTTAAKFPQPVFAQDSEMRGADFMGVPRVTIDTISDLKAFVAGLKGERFETVVLDDFPNSVRRWTTQKAAGLKDPRAAYKQVYAEVIPLLQQLLIRQSHLVVTGHYAKEMELAAGLEKERAWIHPNLPDALEVFCLGFFDVIAYTFNNGQPKALVFESANKDRRIVAGSRAGLPFTKFAAGLDGIVPLVNLAAEVVK